jgi:hypothetical protein
VCYREGGANGLPSIEFTYWDTREQAEQALAELTPCSRRCVGIHSAVAVQLETAPEHAESH